MQAISFTSLLTPYSFRGSAGLPTHFDIALSTGWNLLAQPLTPARPLMSDEILADIRSQGIEATAIVVWRSGRWVIHAFGFDFGAETVSVNKTLLASG